jgi:hypothetical protein
MDVSQSVKKGRSHTFCSIRMDTVAVLWKPNKSGPDRPY